MTAPAEQTLLFDCGDERLLGILHLAWQPQKKLGVIIVVGGPQYRVGSHRQFVLMARSLARAGYAVLRFDYRGMGDSGGQPRTFEQVDADIRAAMQALRSASPGLEGIVLWGLCDGASAILLSCVAGLAPQGVILANPWARTSAGEARAYLKHYYWQRLFSRSLWRKVLTGGFNVGGSVYDLLSKMRSARRSVKTAAAVGKSYIDRMREGLEALQAPALLLLSGRDLTAKEFAALGVRDSRWGVLLNLARVATVNLEQADHTFSEQPALDQATDECITWLDSITRADQRSSGAT